jgi:hypothetical protein
MRSRFRTGLAVLLAAGMAVAAAPQGKPTKVMVHVLARDAKLLGTHVGGARVTLREAATGKVLAKGVQQGESGDTKRIMVEPHRRGAALYDTPDAAGFLATVTLDHPTVVEISAEGPLGHSQATQRASKTLLLVPGEDVLGDGVVLEIHGFILEFLQPAEGMRVKAGDSIPVRAKMTMT